MVELIHCDVEEVNVGPQDSSRDFGAHSGAPAFDPFVFKLVFGFCIHILFILLNEQGNGKDIQFVANVRQVCTVVPVWLDILSPRCTSRGRLAVVLSALDLCGWSLGWTVVARVPGFQRSLTSTAVAASLTVVVAPTAVIGTKCPGCAELSCVPCGGGSICSSPS